MATPLSILSLSLLLVVEIYAQWNPHFASNRNVIVQLFEWKWITIAQECENFLQPKGFGGVQISPPQENLVVLTRPWWERYQPVSYKIDSRSGDEEAFLNMSRRCNNAGVRIYADAVINHMTGLSGVGTDGSLALYELASYPAVSYTRPDFHTPCLVTDYNNADNVRNCQLVGLIDLDHAKSNVREKIINYLNHLISLGVAGFRVDAVKHMWPADLAYIYSQLDDLNTDFGFEAGSRPFIYQEVIDLGGEVISKFEYTPIAPVIEFKYSHSIGEVFRGNDKLTYLQNWGPAWGFVNGFDAVPIIDNHDNQREDNGVTLTYKQPKQYKMATAFMLAHPYGTPKVMSSYAFTLRDVGPPQDLLGNLIPPGFNPDDTCTNGYVCEHRWRQIYNMVGFRNAVAGTGINDWWSDGEQQIAFCRGDKGFVVFTNGGDVNRRFQTCLAPGIYCDVISGSLIGGQCTGKSVEVEVFGWANIYLGALEEDGVLAIHANAKLS